MAAALDPQDVSLLAPKRRLRGYIIGPAEAEDEEPEEESLFEDIDLDSFLKEKSGGRNRWEENSFADLDSGEEGTDEQDGTWTEGVLGGYSLFWGGIARIDVLKVSVVGLRICERSTNFALRFLSRYCAFPPSLSPYAICSIAPKCPFTNSVAPRAGTKRLEVHILWSDCCQSTQGSDRRSR